MNRIAGLEKSQAPWHLRWFYTTLRKMFRKDLTPVRMPGLVWGTIGIILKVAFGALQAAIAMRR